MIVQYLHDRRLRLGVRCLKLFEQRRLAQVVADVEPDANQDGAQQKRHAPAPGEKRLFGDLPGHQREDAIGEEKADRRGQLHKASEETAPFSLRVDLVHHDGGAAPFAAESQTLDDAQ